MKRGRGPRLRTDARAGVENDPHLRLPPALRLARMAEVAFIVVNAYFALVIPAGEGGHVAKVRLVFEALAAMVVLTMLPRRPRPVRVAAMVFAVFVLAGCIPGLVMGAPGLAEAPAAARFSFLLALVACGSQAVVLVACASVRHLPDEPARRS